MRPRVGCAVLHCGGTIGDGPPGDHRLGGGPAELRQGGGLDEPGDALYLVEQGEVELTVKNSAGVVKELARVTDGGFFGEMSLLTGKKRTEAATVTRGTNVWLLYKTELDALVGQYPSIGTSLSQGLASRLAAAEIQVDENRFRRFALFANGSQAELRDVAQHLRPTRYRAGEAVYRAGTRGDTMYFIEPGSEISRSKLDPLFNCFYHLAQARVDVGSKRDANLSVPFQAAARLRVPSLRPARLARPCL